MKNLSDGWADWKGNVQSFVTEVQKVMDYAGVTDPELTPNERLIRHYVSLGILNRPERAGKEALYGFVQLIQYITARVLSNDGWPLAKVAEQVSTASLDELFTLIRPANENQTAMDLIASFKATTPMSRSKESATTKMMSSMDSMSMDKEQYLKRSTELTRRRLEDQNTLIALGNQSGSSKTIDMLEIELTDWCRVLVNRLELTKMAPETPELLGRAVERCLKRELVRQRGRQK